MGAVTGTSSGSYRSIFVEKIQGIVNSVSLDEEKHATVLRFVVAVGEEQIPVEMRGQAVKGVLADGHEVAIEAAGGRGTDGILRPKAVENLTTRSRVSVSHAVPRNVGRIALEIGVSIVSGALGTVVTAQLMQSGTQQRGASPLSMGLALAVGLGVAALVFYLMTVRRRRGAAEPGNE